MEDKKVETFVIPSRLDMIYSIEEELLWRAQKHGFDDGGMFALRLAFDEACVNAIKHGNRCDPNKSVHVEAEFEDGHVTVRVRDEGRGFDVSALTDPRHPKYLRKETGRGVFLIKRFSKSVSFNECGNQITFVIASSRSVSRPSAEA